MNYTFMRDGVEEKVELERWAWGVVYEDGTELHQFSEKGDFFQFGYIDQPRVKMFVMRRTDGAAGRIDMMVSGERQLFHFYRHLVLQAGTPMEQRVKVYVFGWKERGGASMYHYILPDDRLITANEDIRDLTNFALI